MRENFPFSTVWAVSELFVFPHYGVEITEIYSHTRFKKFRESNDSTKEITKYVDS